VPVIQWFTEDGVEILSSDTRYEVAYDLTTGTASLIIKNALVSDEMSYKCVASNKYGTSKTIGVLVVKGMINSDKLKCLKIIRIADSILVYVYRSQIRKDDCFTCLNFGH